MSCPKEDYLFYVTTMEQAVNKVSPSMQTLANLNFIPLDRGVFTEADRMRAIPATGRAKYSSATLAETLSALQKLPRTDATTCSNASSLGLTIYEILDIDTFDTETLAEVAMIANDVEPAKSNDME